MSKVIVFRGKRGASNVDGIDGLGVADVSETRLNDPVFDILAVNQLSKAGNPDFDRGSLASHTNRHGKNVWARNSTTTNFITFSEDFSQWANTFSRFTIIGSTTDPFGSTNATEINLDVDTDNLSGIGEIIEINVFGLPAGGIITISFWIKIISGTVSSLELGLGGFNVPMTTPTNVFQRVFVPLDSLGSFILSINPRGKTGARIALFGVQLEDNNSPTEYIRTVGSSQTINFNGEIERESDRGWLIEEEKENVVRFSGNLSKWTPTNVTIDIFTGLDPFDVANENIRLIWGSVATVTLSTTTAAITPSTAYTVSFYALLTAGSLSALTVSLGGGTAVQMPVVSTTVFVRISVGVTSGAGNGIIISATSDNLSASLNISGVQAELGTLTSYIKTGTLEQTRLADVVKSDIAFNIPLPSNSWSFIFRHKNVLNDSNKKFVFTNAQSGADEFSLSFTDDQLTLKNGTATETITALLFEKIAITYDGSTIKFFNESTLVLSASMTATSFLATTLFIGMDDLKTNAINAHLSNFRFYDVELTTNEIIYLMGA